MNAIASKSISSINLSIYRYDPDSGKKPYMQDLSIDIPEGQDIMVLDLLNMAKEQDPSISFRRSCGEGVCGSDGLNINGKYGLGVFTALSDALNGKIIVIRPLPVLPVI